MKTPAKDPTTETRQIRDIGLATAFTAKGWPVDLVESADGVILFSFKGTPRELAEIESDYWSGKLKLSARDVITSQRQLKDRLYALKSSRREDKSERRSLNGEPPAGSQGKP